MRTRIKLPDGILSEIIKVSVVQIGYKLYVNRDSNCVELFEGKPYSMKVFDILDELGKDGVNLTVLPEYSLSKSMLVSIKKIVDKWGFLLIGGSYHDTHSKQNVCPIIIPDCNTVTFAKSCLAPFEQKYVIPADEVGISIEWQVGAASYVIQCYICLDYLSSALYEDAMLDAETGIAVVVSCSNALSDFFNLANIHLRHEKGKFVVIANAARSTLRFNEREEHLLSNGQSSVFGSFEEGRRGMPYIMFEKGLSIEGVLGCNINLGNPKYTEEKPTPVRRRFPMPPIYNGSIRYLRIKEEGLALP